MPVDAVRAAPMTELEPAAAIGWGFVLVAVGLVLGRGGMSLARRVLPAEPAPRQVPLRTVMGTAVALLVALVVLNWWFMPAPLVPDGAPAGLEAAAEPPSPEQLELALALTSVALAATAAFAMASIRREGGSLRDLGFALERPLAAPLLAAGTWAVLLPLTAGVYFLKSGILEWLDRPLEQQEAVEILSANPELLRQVWVVAVVAVAMPFLEELLYRGVLLGFLLGVMRPAWAILADALLFAALHDGSRELIFLLSVGLAWLYHRTRSLLAPVLLHIMHNSLTLLFLPLAETR